MAHTLLAAAPVISILSIALTACGGGGGDGGGGGAPGPAPIIALPRTGQTTCSDAAGTATTCAGSGQDGELQIGVAEPSPRFVVDGTGDCVTDNLTGLMWARNANLLAGAGAPSTGAISYSDAVLAPAGLSLCGFSDWRLPNRKELRSLINYGLADNSTSLNALGFTNVQAFEYWSSSNRLGQSTGGGWFVDMRDGSSAIHAKGTLRFVWPVRTGQAAQAELPETGQTTCTDHFNRLIDCTNTRMDGDLKAGVSWPNPRFTLGSGATAACITDNLTGLMWVRAPDTNPTTWTNALASANGLTLCGFSDWRLPNINELESLVNIGTTSSVIPASPPTTYLHAQGFSGVQTTGDTGGGGGYWSSTSYAGDAGNAWLVYMGEGSIAAIDKSVNLEFVLPVRTERSR
jgi:hypothetical protein